MGSAASTAASPASTWAPASLQTDSVAKAGSSRSLNHSRTRSGAWATAAPRAGCDRASCECAREAGGDQGHRQGAERRRGERTAVVGPHGRGKGEKQQDGENSGRRHRNIIIG